MKCFWRLEMMYLRDEPPDCELGSCHTRIGQKYSPASHQTSLFFLLPSP
jgi:hypothetical protein